jgi:hypothetical protein
MPMKKSTDTIGNGTRDLPVCSAVPQPTAPPRPPGIWIKAGNLECFYHHVCNEWGNHMISTNSSWFEGKTFGG